MSESTAVAQIAPESVSISSGLLSDGLPVLGYIKIGMQRPGSEGGKGKAPTKIDHFRITTRVREVVSGNQGNFMLDSAVHQVVGEKPKELDIRLPFPRATQNVYAQMVHYSGNTRARQCNGESYVDPGTGVGGACAKRAGKTCSCKPYARLGVMLEAAPTYGGLYVFRTTSWESVRSLQTGLASFEREFGTLRGLPLRMVLYPAEVQYKSGADTKVATAYKVGIVLRATYDQAREAALDFHRKRELAVQEITRLAHGTMGALSAMDRREGDDIGGEFFPAGGGPALSKVGEQNRILIGAGETQQAQPTEAPKPEAPAIEPNIQALVDELQGLLGGGGVELTFEERSRLDEAVASGQEILLQKSIAWLRFRLPPTADEVTALEDLIAKGLTADVITPREVEGLNATAKSGNGLAIRKAIKEINTGLAKVRETD